MVLRYFTLILYGFQHAFAAHLPAFQESMLAPLLNVETPRRINNSYIVMLKPGVDSQSLVMHMDSLQSGDVESPLVDFDSGLTHVYDSPKTKGYAGIFSDIVVEQIRARPEVDYIEQDQMVWASSLETQRNAPWGLARISHRDRFPTITRYDYDSSGGEGVDIYVIDTGININHVEFQGRAKWGKTMPANDLDEDGHGHGTHCAGTIGSRRYGVAKKANLIAVKVLRSNGSGTMSDVVAGVVWTSNEATRNAAKARAELATSGFTAHKGSVANMSLGGGKSRVLEDAVNAAVGYGMHFTVAAGNDDGDACESSPAGARSAITVGASTRDDERAYFSNYGKCVDVFAPGLNILSTWIGSNLATHIISGTSMAAPHTAGMVAYLLSLYSPNTSNSDQENAKAFIQKASGIISGYPIAGLEPVLGAMQSVLPIWLSKLLVGASQPKQFVDAYEGGYDVAAVPGTLSPEEMKKTVIRLATSDALSDLPRDTPNLLIFNGAGGLS